MEIKDELRQKIWEKGIKDEHYNPDKVRKDACGAWMIYDQMNRDENPFFAWEVDHIIPVSVLKEHNVPDDLINDIRNLRPLNWNNNNSKGNDYPSYKAVIVSKDDKNIRTEEYKEVSASSQNELKNLYKDYGL